MTQINEGNHKANGIAIIAIACVSVAVPVLAALVTDANALMSRSQDSQSCSGSSS